MEERWYAAIDLKSFYASVECVERGLDPLDALLVVADRSRTTKTICLAVSPGLKAYGVSGRARLFEVEEWMGRINALRRQNAHRKLVGSSTFVHELQADPTLQADYITAPPQMRKYMAYSAKIYGIYLRHVAPEDIQVYSIDEVFIDLTPYLGTYGLTPRALTEKMMSAYLYSLEMADSAEEKVRNSCASEFEEKDRTENIRRIAEVSKLMNDAGLIALTAFISPYISDRQNARDIIGTDSFIEIYVSTPLEECEKRDVKGLYKKARDGKIPNFTGIGSPYQPPEHPEITIDTTGYTVEEAAEYIIDALSRYI